MSKLTWDGIGEKQFETGTSQGVLYVQSNGAYPKGVSWNGLTSVTESPSGADENAFYADNIKYGSLRGAEEFGGTINCYAYPNEWAECDGAINVVPGLSIGQQKRKPFGFSYRSEIGNDADGIDHGYKIHLIYNATVSPSEAEYQTINDSPEGIEFSYEFTTTPIAVSSVAGAKPVSRITVDSTQVSATQLATLEAAIYGTEDADPYLPLPDAVIAMFPASEG